MPPHKLRLKVGAPIILSAAQPGRSKVVQWNETVGKETDAKCYLGSNTECNVM